MTGHQVIDFCGTVPRQKRSYCHPGAAVNDITASLDEDSDGASNNYLFFTEVLMTFANPFRVIVGQVPQTYLAVQD